MARDDGDVPARYGRAAAEAVRLWRWNVRVADEAGTLAPGLRACATALAQEHGLDRDRVRERAEPLLTLGERLRAARER